MSPVPANAPALAPELEALMRQLKMPHARALAPELIATARAQRWEPAEVIKALFVEEVTGRSRSMLATRRKAAGFPTGKTFDTWDPAASSIPAPTQQAQRTLEWIGRKENVVICGPSGTGKTLFLEALGQQAVEAGMRVAWFRLEDLGALMRAHRSDDSVTKVVGRILRADLVVVDDIGLLPVGTDAAEGLYRLVDAAYEKRSIAVSSNLHPAGFDELMPKTLATATVDRLLHHAHVCQTSGDSIRLSQALAGSLLITEEIDRHATNSTALNVNFRTDPPQTPNTPPAGGGQESIAEKTNEIPHFKPQLEQVGDLDGAVVTADALHTQRAHAKLLHLRGAHYVLTVKGSQKALLDRIKFQTWFTREVGYSEWEKAHGRTTHWSATAQPAQDWIDFPHAAQTVLTREKTNHQTGSGRPNASTRSRPYAPRKPARPSWQPTSADTGASKTDCTGSGIPPWARTSPRSARATRHM